MRLSQTQAGMSVRILPFIASVRDWLVGHARDRWHWGLPLALWCCLTVLTLGLWRLELWDEHAKVVRLMDVMAQRVAMRIDYAANDHLASLEPLRLPTLRTLRGLPQTPDAFDRAAQILLNASPEYEMIGWINQQGVCQAIAPQSQSALVGQDLTRLLSWDRLVNPALKSGRCTAADLPEGEESRSLAVVILIPPLDASLPAPGAIIACLDLGKLIQGAIDADSRAKLVVYLDDQPRPLTGPDFGVARFETKVPVDFFGQVRYVRVQPRPHFAYESVGRSPDWVLFGGLLASVMVGFIAYQTLGYRAAHGLRTRRHLEALESLNEISAAISSRLGSGNAVLTQLADAARQLLNMDRAGVCILHRQNQVLEILAAAGDMPASYPRFFPLESIPACKRCVEHDQMIFIEDTARLDMPFNPEVAALFSAGSFILIPLRTGQQMGLMTLGRSSPRTLTALDRRLAQLLGAQASVILANNRLYQQMREALQSRDVLLRELNHRVKNNLAAIVSLLSIGKPELPPAAQAWLDRAVERISMMAGAYALFSGQMQKIGLRQLLDQVVSSLAVVRPSGVATRIEGVPAEVSLSTDQAVSLVMVLHELCYNALVHGLRGMGTLTLRAVRVEPQSLAIDVVDDGRGLDAGPAPQGVASAGMATQGTGLGLELVKGLVCRELRGRFSLSAREGGGMVASVVFPLTDLEQDKT